MTMGMRATVMAAAVVFVAGWLGCQSDEPQAKVSLREVKTLPNPETRGTVAETKSSASKTKPAVAGTKGVVVDDDVAELIKQLSHEDRDMREKAMAELWKRGQAIEGALKEAIKKGDGETQWRAKKILERFALGDRPDVALEFRKLGQEYSTADMQGRAKIVENLGSRQPPLEPVPPPLEHIELLLGIEKENPGELLAKDFRGDAIVAATRAAVGHEQVLKRLLQLRAKVRHAKAVELMAHGDRVEAERVVTKWMDEVRGREEWSTIDDYVALRLWRGQDAVEESIKEWEGKAGVSRPEAQLVLSVLNRVAGHYQAALKNIEAYFGNEACWVACDMLMKAGQWRELAQYVAAHKSDFGPWQFYRARLPLWWDFAGYEAASREALKDVEADFAADPKRIRDNLGATAYALSGGVGKFVEMMHAAGESGDYNFMMLAQERFRESSAMVNPIEHQARANYREDWYRFATLWLLGEKERALDWIGRGDKKRFDENGPVFYSEAVWFAEGSKQQFLAAKISAEGKATWKAKYEIKEYMAHSGALDGWGIVALIKKTRPAVVAEDVFVELRSNRMEAREQVALCRELSKERSGIGSQLAYLLVGNGQLEEGWKLHEEIAAQKGSKSIEALLHREIEQQNWAKAMAWSEMLGEVEPSKQANALWRKGWLLEKTGKKEDGTKLRELAKWVSLGDNQARINLAREMIKCGQREEAIQTVELNERLFGRDYSRDIMLTRCEAAEARGDFEAAWNLSLGDLRFVTGPQDVFRIRRLRALAAMVVGRVKDAEREAEKAREAMPGAIELVVDLVPRLDKAGEKVFAEKLYAEVWDFNAGILKEYPRSVQHHQRLAVMAMVCGRNMEEGKKHAAEAVRLEPGDEAFRKKVEGWK